MLLVFLLSAAAAVQAEPLTCNGQPVENINPATMVHVRLGAVAADGSPAPQEGGFTLEPAPGAQEVIRPVSAGNAGTFYGYSRLSVRYTPCEAAQRSLVPEKRNAITRFFAGKQVDKVLQVSVTITNPKKVKVATSFAGIHRKSGKAGEEWSTDIENGTILLPFIRIDENTLVRIQADFTATRDYNTSIGADVIQIAKQASAAISPAVPLITDQNRDRFNEAANFFDKTLNGLLHVSMLENPGRTFALANRSGGQDLAVVTLVVPWANDVYPSAQQPMVAVGKWTIFAEPFRKSMLAKVNDGGNPVPGSFTAATVMNFGVTEDKTLGEALAGSSSVVAARDALVAASESEAADPARVFCRAVQGEAEKLDLSPLDTALAAWAALANLALPERKTEIAEGGCNRIEFFRGVATAARAALGEN